MTSLEYKQLEELLAKLQLEIGGKKYCIIPGHIHDGYHIGIYSSNSGDVLKTADAATIEDAVKALKEK